jgi:uncharacterized protein (TIGR02118 family)
MVHLLFLMKRKPELSRQECQRHWREIHAPLAQRIPGIRRYVQSHVFTAQGEKPPYDGVAEIWVDDERAATAVFQTKEYLEGAYLDEPNFVDVKQVVRLRTEDHVILTGAPINKDERLVKRISFLKRKPGMNREEFFRYWQDVHGPLALKLGPASLRAVPRASVDVCHPRSALRRRGSDLVHGPSGTARDATVEGLRRRDEAGWSKVYCSNWYRDIDSRRKSGDLAGVNLHDTQLCLTINALKSSSLSLCGRGLG